MFTIDDVRTALSDCLKGERPGAARAFTGVTNDSRVAKPGELFVALTTPPGYALAVRDGHDFISDAVAHGATGVILHKEDILLPDHIWAFLVDDTQHAIGELSRAWRSRFDVRAIAIAGNVGKTTTKELTAAVLQGCGHTVLKSPMNFNDEIGLAMTLFQLDPTYDRAVVEVGMFELGEIRRLCQIAQPQIGVVLNVGPTHLERLGSMQAIAEAKSEAVRELPATGCAILNADDPLVAAMAPKTRARVLTFGTHRARGRPRVRDPEPRSGRRGVHAWLPRPQPSGKESSARCRASCPTRSPRSPLRWRTAPASRRRPKR